MIRTINACAAGLALCLAMAAGIDWSATGNSAGQPEPRRVASLDWVELGAGERGLRDASAKVIRLRDFRCIVSGSIVADALLFELASPERICAYSIYSENSPLGAHHYDGKPRLQPLEDLEGLLALKPDLLLLNSHGDPAKIARLERAGLPVFNLGQMDGVASYVENAAIVGALLGQEARGRGYAKRYIRRLQAVAPARSESSKKTALYVAIYGGKMFGGARHTSYHDVLTNAGLIDIAAKDYQGWPQYDAERILEMDPQVLVTIAGMKEALCRPGNLAPIRACRGESGVVELPRDLIGNPGAGMLPAAEALHDFVYGAQ